jgi:hypothetical protein
MGTPSLLLALLKDDVQPNPSTQLDKNIKEVVDSIENNALSLAKNVAQQKLYEALYSIIKEEYSQDSIYNKAIGKALENAIQGAEQGDTIIQALRDKLRTEIFQALTPK